MSNNEGNIKILNAREIKAKSFGSRVATLYLLALITYLFFVFVFPFDEGRQDMSVAGIVTAIQTKFIGVVKSITGHPSSIGHYALLRNTTAFFVGAGLAVAGATFQSGFKNVLASPSVLGVSSGAMLGNAVYIILFTVPVASVQVVQQDNDMAANLSLISLLSQEILAIAGSLLAMLIVMLFISVVKRFYSSNLSILFCGMAVSALFGSALSIIEYAVLMKDNSDDRLQNLMSLSMGTMDRVQSVNHLVALLCILIPTMLFLVSQGNKLNVLQFGEMEASASGIDTIGLKIATSAIGSVLVASTVAFCGQIGLVGFVTPILARRFAGNSMQRVYIFAAPIGGMILLVVYNIASALQLSACMGVVSSAIGCIAMFIILLKGGKQP